jgi:putative acetyltransferase
MNLFIRDERPSDHESISNLLKSAFPTGAEARLVDLLRERGKATCSLVAEAGGELVGHILFSPVTVQRALWVVGGLGLAPVAVSPPHQRRGVGSRLIEEGLSIGRTTGRPFVVVLGEPDYYRRFGFRPARIFGLSNEYAVDDPFMIIELSPGRIPAGGGLVRYAPEFAEALSITGGQA